jgi:hypothetical protein
MQSSNQRNANEAAITFDPISKICLRFINKEFAQTNENLIDTHSGIFY